MKSKLVYRGYEPVHSLGVTWGHNQELGIDSLYKIFQSRAERVGIPGPTREFADWVYANYLQKLSGGFEFLIDESDFSNQPTVKVAEQSIEEFSGIIPKESATTTKPAEKFTSNSPTPLSADHTVTVEASNLKAAASFEEAQQRLQNMRHPDASGTVERQPRQELPSSDMATLAKNAPPPGSQVMSGDDLAKSNALNESMTPKKAVSTVLTPAAGGVEAAKVESVTEEQVHRAHNDLANANRGSKVLVPDELQGDGSKVKVVSGDHFNQSYEPAKQTIVTPAPDSEVASASTEPDSDRVNSNFQGFQGMSSGIEVSIDDIVRNPDPVKSKEMIANCTSSRTLKLARNMFRDKGNQKMVDAIDIRLRQLPPVSM
jgi:hypothetical protein